jgi:hypothetical protein
LEKDREKDTAKRNAAKRDAYTVDENIQNAISHYEAVKDEKEEVPKTQQTKPCTTCCRECDIKDFIGQNGITKTCKQCRDSNKRQDKKRDKEHRAELAKIKEKTANIKYVRCVKDARCRNIDLTLSFEQYSGIIQNPCFYCGEKSEIEISENEDRQYNNGIDRKNNAIGYVFDNCVSCCKMCNYMKHSLSVDVFIHRIKHIISHNGFYPEVLSYNNPELFPDGISSSYVNYKNGAFRRNLVFEISEADFSEFIKNDCYICGKKSSNTHRNGIDRAENTIGYTYQNIRPCCKECNYMKYVYDYEDFINKCKQIYNHFKIDASDSEIPFGNCSIVKRKKSHLNVVREIRVKKEEHIQNLKNVFIPTV